MKSILSVFILFGVGVAQGPDHAFLPKDGDVEIVVHSHYVVGYSEAHEQAAWVAYELTSAETRGVVARSNDFRADPMVSTGSASLEDYRGSGYDRGHLAPAGDMGFSARAMSESFFLSNMSPQVAGFNRGIWRKLEGQFRRWARAKGSLYVVTAGVLDEGFRTVGTSGVSVPGSYYKIGYSASERRVIAFLMNNEPSPGPLSRFVVPVDLVEERTGLDFFAELEDTLEEQIESGTSVSSWMFYEESEGRSSDQSLGPPAVATQCTGTDSRTGLQCKLPAVDAGAYCRNHRQQAEGAAPGPGGSSPSGRCVATTAAGLQCKRKAGAAGKYCWQHD